MSRAPHECKVNSAADVKETAPHHEWDLVTRWPVLSIFWLVKFVIWRNENLDN